MKNQVYDKPYINDKLVNLDFLTNKKNYNPLGQHRSFINRWLYPKPLYLKHSQVSLIVPVHHYIIRVLGSILFAYLGYQMSMYEANVENQFIEESKIVDFESEDQIFDYLYN